jgi:hypothetical protein
MDIIEKLQRNRIAEINEGPSERETLAEKYGDVWDTSEVQQEFDIVGFGAPYVVVIRKSDNVKGSLEFRHSPRFYFNFQEA